ncbi:MAG TPA: hypothetical protein VHO73_12230 [Methylomirabilota bacterium]|jgi:hypothetical protein|nr:hypothetical protein [Methylomirabilota bacterium]
MQQSHGRPNSRIASVTVALGLILGTATASLGQAPSFTEAELFFELNDTDGDLGIHASIDGGPYVMLEIEDPSGREILKVTALGRLFKQGLTQLSLESVEEPFEVLTPTQFFARFPEGWYEIEGTTRQGKEFKSRVRLSHVMAAPPSDILVGALPAAENCDDPNLPTVRLPVSIDWAPVEDSHPTIGKPGSVEIVRYQFFVEQGDFKFGVDLPPTVTEFVVPAANLTSGVVKFEIIARTSTGNNTAIESCFVVQ